MAWINIYALALLTSIIVAVVVVVAMTILPNICLIPFIVVKWLSACFKIICGCHHLQCAVP